MIDTLDSEFETIYSEKKDLVLCCVECGDTGFKLGREFERNKIQKLKQENAILKENIERTKDTANSFFKTNKKLKQENFRLREALEFYAKNENWLCGFSDDTGDSISADDWEISSSITKRKYVGGKRARQALKGKEE